MEKIINELISKVKEKADLREFIHNKWFVEFHLSIVEKISLELCEVYKDADENLVRIIVWMHDYGKIVDFESQKAATLSKGAEFFKGARF